MCAARDAMSPRSNYLGPHPTFATAIAADMHPSLPPGMARLLSGAAFSPAKVRWSEAEEEGATSPRAPSRASDEGSDGEDDDEQIADSQGASRTL